MKMSRVFEFPEDITEEIIAYEVCEKEEALDAIVCAVRFHDKLVAALQEISDKMGSSDIACIAYDALKGLEND